MDSQVVNTRVVRAGQNEIIGALNLAAILEDVFHREQQPRNHDGTLPADLCTEYFDLDEPKNQQQLIDVLKQWYASYKGIYCVALGYYVLADPENEILDQEEPCLQLHPKWTEKGGANG